ncbi:epoxide hydrolase family protein [Nocardia africana]|uniref:Soluble epoxide hydrolase n=1 Tax=Nocardia africana TaxID=134964 RepID=A0A378WRN9_9NOCA|nr:epoxide hydrolase family protein [Nocardia africana]MCC3314348.1 epoxide hydrolase [Nocardia africana]SUA43387.1 Soluble epoxide hydrolase [Nocardia africana]
MSTEISPFRIDIPREQLDDLHRRLDATRWPDADPGAGWRQGIPLGYTRELAEYWRTGYDWREQEARLNAFPQFRTDIDGHTVHFIHLRSAEPDALPLVLTHGWPGSIVEFLELIGPLTDPVAHGGAAEDAFHVVVPTVPGFGMSGPAVGWSTTRVARAWAELMRRLGYDRYAAHGEDTGAAITRHLAVLDADHLVAMRLTMIASATVTAETADPGDPAEQRAVELARRARDELGAYAMLQATRPQTLSYALTDSPVGQLAWIVERFKDWTDSTDAPEDAVDRDAMLTNVMIYWLNGTAGSSARYYYEGAATWGMPEPDTDVPTAVAVMPHDLGVPVLRIAERNHNIVRWTVFERGGHFAAMEEPDLIVDDLRAGFREYRW